MEGYRKIQEIQELINNQKEINQTILDIFKDLFENTLKIEGEPKINIEFGKNNIIKIKIKETSSLRFMILRNKDIIFNKFKNIYPDTKLIIS